MPTKSYFALKILKKRKILKISNNYSLNHEQHSKFKRDTNSQVSLYFLEIIL